MLGIIPRFAARTNTAKHIHWYETFLIIGGALGNSISVRELSFAGGGIKRGILFLLLFGLAVGMFVGCQAMALAELLQVMPILVKRLRLQIGMPVLVLAIALGKMVGSFVQMFFGW